MITLMVETESGKTLGKVTYDKGSYRTMNPDIRDIVESRIRREGSVEKAIESLRDWSNGYLTFREVR